jgi:hypothetical protein
VGKHKTVQQGDEGVKLTALIGQFHALASWLTDEYMPLLTGNQWKVLTYVWRKTIGFGGKVSDQISYSQFIDGDDKQTHGTGLSRDEVSAALEALRRYGFISADEKYSKHPKGMLYTVELDPANIRRDEILQDVAARKESGAVRTQKARHAKQEKKAGLSDKTSNQVDTGLSDKTSQGLTSLSDKTTTSLSDKTTTSIVGQTHNRQPINKSIDDAPRPAGVGAPGTIDNRTRLVDSGRTDAYAPRAAAQDWEDAIDKYGKTLPEKLQDELLKLDIPTLCNLWVAAYQDATQEGALDRYITSENADFITVCEAMHEIDDRHRTVLPRIRKQPEQTPYNEKYILGLVRSTSNSDWSTFYYECERCNLDWKGVLKSFRDRGLISSLVQQQIVHYHTEWQEAGALPF